MPFLYSDQLTQRLGWVFLCLKQIRVAVSFVQSYMCVHDQ
nr:MAG TPA_asm: hypothetical protein [Caudoviricetes sp.]